MRGRIALALLAAGLVVSACGTGGGRSLDMKALTSGQGAGSQATGAEGGAAAEQTGAAAADAAGGVAGGSTSAAKAAGGAAGSAAAGAAGAAQGAGRAASLAAGSPVTIGVQDSKNVQAAFTAFGASGAKDNAKDSIEAIVAWINAHGGMGGHKVNLVYHAIDPTNGSFDSQAQETCSAFTEDNHVFAAVGGAIMPSRLLADCLGKRGVPFVWDYQYLLTKSVFDGNPLLFQPFSVAAERLGFYVDGLVSQGFFAPNSVVGIVRYDNAIHTQFVASIVRPRLAAHGIAVRDEAAISDPRSAADAGSTVSSISSAILRFRAEGVDHVLFAPSGGAIPFLFMPAAAGQGFSPRYALNSLDIPRFVEANVPASQLRNGMVVGWSPAGDIKDGIDVPPGNPSEALCYSITKDHSDFSVRFCDGLFFLKQVLDRAPTLNADSLRASVDSLGTTFNSPFTFATSMGPGRHDGASVWRPMVFNDQCACFRYTGPPQPIP